MEASVANSEDYKSYLCIIPGNTLADIYDEFDSHLLEGNVRSFLSTKVAVNKKIRETILKSPQNFFAYDKFGKVQIKERTELLIQLVRLIWNEELFK